MRLVSTGLFVDNQDKALVFYTEKLGFVVKKNIPVGEFRWLTLVSEEEPNGIELTLEPNIHPAAKDFQSRIYKDGIPANMFAVKNIDDTYETLKKKGVKFHTKPTSEENYKYAVIDDTCGNLIQLFEQK